MDGSDAVTVSSVLGCKITYLFFWSNGNKLQDNLSFEDDYIVLFPQILSNMQTLLVNYKRNQIET